MQQWIQELDGKWTKQEQEGNPFTRGQYSQSYQEELLDTIFENIGTRNPTPFCVEFGFNTSTLSAGSGANIGKLVLEHQWDSLLLDGGNENPDINLYKHFLTPSNICGLFKKYNVPQEPEYVSVDVDSTDLWLFEAVIKEYKAMVFSVEYNSNYPIDAAITFPNSQKEHWQRDRGYGASLKALTLVAEANGYSLLWVVPYLDAFFIRNDLIADGTEQTCFPYEKWASRTSLPAHGPLKNPHRAKMFLDYAVYQSTGGNIRASRKAALPVCKKILLDSDTPIPSLPKRILQKLTG